MGFKKLATLRQELLKTDVKKDKYLVLDGRKIEYVSIDSMKRALSPALAKAGVDLSFSIKNIDESKPNRVRLTTEFTLSDCDSDDEESTIVISDGTGNKALQTAMSYGLRMFLGTKFLLVDGLFDEDEAEAPASAFALPETPAPAPASVPTPAPAPEKPMGHSAPLSRVEAIARDNSVRWFNEAHENGKISEEEWGAISKLIENCTSGSALQELLCARRKIEAQILDRKV